jgi:hypothetical protein
MLATQMNEIIAKTIAGYFPAYLPLVLMLLKCVMLELAGGYKLASIFPDLTFAVLSFDIWAITSKLKGQTLRISGNPQYDEGIMVWGLFFFHLVVYLLNMLAWLKPSDFIALKIIASFLAVLLFFTPVLVLGNPIQNRDSV